MMSTKSLGARISVAVLSAIALSVAMTGAASAAAIRMGSFTSNTIPANDDDSSPLTALGFTADFFGTTYSNAYVNNNGNITFNGPLDEFTPFGIAGASTPIIAAFFADVDTTGAGTSPVTYGTGTVNGRNAFGANYINVGYFDAETDKINDFQIVLIDRADTGAGNFDIEFNYDQVQWETGSAASSGGSNGLGGNSARVGYSNGLIGAANRSFELAGSAVNGAFLDGGPAGTSLIANSLNSGGLLGRYTFNARNGAVVNPPTNPSAVPEPSDLIGTALGGLAIVMLKRKLSVAKKG
ncbi:nidogen-like domain-containing protein [Chamaesiphon sp.]|uniref:nidogen-like domain-containing protein n=1 Tax=Chamaesiphon sp. TaxID=2814140 RepID=UPI0035942785